MSTFFAISIVFSRQIGNVGSLLSPADCPKNISPSIIDKLEQSYFATGYM
jgi:hypothetical protein